MVDFSTVFMLKMIYLIISECFAQDRRWGHRGRRPRAPWPGPGRRKGARSLRLLPARGAHRPEILGSRGRGNGCPPGGAGPQQG